MTLIIHDMDDDLFNKTIFSKIKDSKVINLDSIKPCIGCFSCWCKTPGICSLIDDFRINGTLLHNANKLIVISKNNYGTFSSKIKNFFDRSISYVKPQFGHFYNETHHYKRYKKRLKVDYYFYGPYTAFEKDTIIATIKANSKNMHTDADLFIIDNMEDYYE